MSLSWFFPWVSWAKPLSNHKSSWPWDQLMFQALDIPNETALYFHLYRDELAMLDVWKPLWFHPSWHSGQLAARHKRKPCVKKPPLKGCDIRHRWNWHSICVKFDISLSWMKLRFFLKDQTIQTSLPFGRIQKELQNYVGQNSGAWKLILPKEIAGWWFRILHPIAEMVRGQFLHEFSQDDESHLLPILSFHLSLGKKTPMNY